MTRINCVDPSILSDKHLVAEYNELPRVFSLVLQTEESARWLRATHRTYKMGSGHLKFFYTKCLYLKKRYVELYREMLRRGMKPRGIVVKLVLTSAKQIDKEYCGDWEPTEADWAENLKRLKERDPRFYRKF